MKNISLAVVTLVSLVLALGGGDPVTGSAAEHINTHPGPVARGARAGVIDGNGTVGDAHNLVIADDDTVVVQDMLANVQATSGPALVGCVALDDSDSNRVGNPNDPPADPGPVLVRVEATKYIVSHLGTEGRADRLGIVVFGGSGPDDLVEIPLTVIDGPEVRAWLGTALDGAIHSKGWTNWTRAISTCLEMLERAGFGQAPSQSPPPFSPFIVFVSDGRPEDEAPGASTDEQLRQLRESQLPELASRGIPVFAIGYAGAADTTSPEAGLMRELAEATGGGFLAARSPGDLLPLADSILASLRGGRLDSGDAVSVSQSTTIPVTVPAGTERLFIGARRSDADIDVDLVAPGGLAVDSAAAGVDRSESVTFVTWSITRPPAGTWQVKAVGEGIIVVDSTVIGPTPIPTPAAGAAPVPTTDTDGGSGLLPELPLWWLAAAAAVATPLGLTAFAITRLRAPRIPGWITIGREDTHD